LEDVLARSPRDWLDAYSRSMAAAACLFGTYEGLKRPLAYLALDLLTGGEAYCRGSTNVDLCEEVFRNAWTPSEAMQSITGAASPQETVLRVFESLSQ